MTVNFPNQSRSFDARGNRVRFWGYDNAMEIAFFIEAAAIRKLKARSDKVPEIETEFLQVFDAARDRIYTVAQKVHARAHRGSYAHTLTAADF